MALSELRRLAVELGFSRTMKGGWKTRQAMCFACNTQVPFQLTSSGDVKGVVLEQLREHQARCPARQVREVKVKPGSYREGRGGGQCCAIAARKAAPARCKRRAQAVVKGAGRLWSVCPEHGHKAMSERVLRVWLEVAPAGGPPTSTRPELVWLRAATHQGRHAHALLVPPPSHRGIVRGPLAQARDALCGILMPRDHRPPRKGEKRCPHCLEEAVKKHRKLLRLSGGQPLLKCPSEVAWRLGPTNQPKAHAFKMVRGHPVGSALCPAAIAAPAGSNWRTGRPFKAGERGGPPRKSDKRCQDCELITMQREGTKR